MKYIWQIEKVDNWVSPAQTIISINAHKYGNKKMVKVARSGFRDVLTKPNGQKGNLLSESSYSAN